MPRIRQDFGESCSTSSIRIGMTPAAVATGDDDIPSRCGGRSGGLRAVAIECWKMGSWRSNPTAGAPREWLSTRPSIFLGRLEVRRAESNGARAPTAPPAPHSHTTHRTPTGGCSRRYRPGWARRGAYGPARWSPVLGVRASRAARQREAHGGPRDRGAHPRCQSASPIWRSLRLCAGRTLLYPVRGTDLCHVFPSARLGARC